MSRLENTFKTLNRPAMVSFITAGDPDHETSLKLLESLPKSGADIVELGMPFSDPVADGPVIELASQRALKAGASMKKTLALVKSFREKNTQTPLVLMGYANPIYAYGVQQFAKDAAQAGVDGVLVVDLPPEESQALEAAAKDTGLDVIRLITPTTDETRLATVLHNARGFLYYVSVAGITGAASAQAENIAPHIAMIRKKTDLPIVIGFGIKTPQDVKNMAGLGDGVVIGSALVNTIAENAQDTDLENVLSDQLRTLAKAI